MIGYSQWLKLVAGGDETAQEWSRKTKEIHVCHHFMSVQSTLISHIVRKGCAYYKIGTQHYSTGSEVLIVRHLLSVMAITQVIACGCSLRVTQVWHTVHAPVLQLCQTIFSSLSGIWMYLFSKLSFFFYRWVNTVICCAMHFGVFGLWNAQICTTLTALQCVENLLMFQHVVPLVK